MYTILVHFLFLTNYLEFNSKRTPPMDEQHLPAEGMHPTAPQPLHSPSETPSDHTHPITPDNCITEPHFIFRPDSIVTLIKF